MANYFKIFFLFVALIFYSVFMFGIMIPKLISAKSDFYVIGGFLLICISLFIVIIITVTIYRWYLKADAEHKRKRNLIAYILLLVPSGESNVRYMTSKSYGQPGCYNGRFEWNEKFLKTLSENTLEEIFGRCKEG